MNHRYNLQFSKLCNTLKLGELIDKPEEMSGGLLHRMFALETTQGKYAVKALNPQIMARPTALNNFINAEKIVNLVACSIPAQPAKSFDGYSIHSIDNQYYLVFDWIEGRSLYSSDLLPAHCMKIGSILATIHRTDASNLGLNLELPNAVPETDWRFYVHKGLETNALWASVLNENFDNLISWSAKVKRSSEVLASDKVIGHRDLEPKNVMWIQDKPIIIDWESAGFIHPLHDLVETAIYWSKNDHDLIDKSKFLAFISGYQDHRGMLHADWRLILEQGYLSKLDWLEYSLKRSLWIECSDEKEQQLGTEQVEATLSALQRYHNTITELEAWLNEL